MGLNALRPLLSAAALLLVLPHESIGQSTGRITIPPVADTTRVRITAEVGLPAGFDMSIFAAPPHLTYPTAIHPAGAGVVFVATDPNLLFGRERYLGRILRFVDEDADGVADSYTVFADSLDSVRGVTVDGETVYVMHAPTLATYRDRDGDGVADEKQVLVEGLGFGLDDRNGDHTSNGIRLGLDGWIYIAVGDYGFLDATGTDGRQIYLHRGGVVRVRPDGSELEIVARGTRNIYDIALDSHLRLFARDNNNNGQGWNSRFHYLPVGADAGYPSLFRNFPVEMHPALADFGAGAATTTLWMDEPSFPAPLHRGLVSADWALNRIYRHSLTPAGGTFEISQEEIMTIPRPVDMEVSPGGSLFIASLSGGSYDYAGEHVGYILRLRPSEAGEAAMPLGSAGPEELVEALLSGSHSRRLQAQRALLTRPASERVRERLEGALFDAAVPVPARIAVLFTLKQMVGEESHPTLTRAAADPALREAALRAMVDRRGELAGIPHSLYLEGLHDQDPMVRQQAVRGISRLVPPGAADLLMQSATDPDATVAHVARNALTALGPSAAGAALRALDTDDPAAREAALQVLSRLHSSSVVTELARRLFPADPQRQIAILGALARLYHREGHWDGEWWGNQPSTEGPYFDPVEWTESPRIRSLLLSGLRLAQGTALDSLLARLEREGVIPRESAGILSRRDDLAPEAYAALAGLLVGGRELSPAALHRLVSIGSADPSLRETTMQVVVALPGPPAAAAPVLAAAAVDEALSAPLRARALAALTRTSSADPASTSTAYASIVEALPRHPELLQAWRRYVGDRARAGELDHFLGLAGEGQADERTLAYAVLERLSQLPRLDEGVRASAAAAVEAAWSEEPAAAALARAIRLLGVEESYGERLRNLDESGS